MRTILQIVVMLLLAWGPLGHAAAQAQQISRLTYREPNSTNTTDVEKRAATETVGGTSFTYGGYSSSATASTTNPITEIFQLTSDQQGVQLDARMLIWRQNNQGVAPAAPSTEVNQNTTYAAFVTLTFNREVTNLRLVMQDIDKGTPADGGSNFTDQVAFRALNTAGQYVDLTGSNIGYGANGTNTSSTINTFDNNISIGGVVYDAVRGTDLNGEVSSNPSRTGNVTVTFPQPVRTVRLAFRNLNTISPIPNGQTQLRLQTFGIEEISWNAQADVSTTITPSVANTTVGSTPYFTVNFANAAGTDPAGTLTTQVQLAPNLTGVTLTNQTGVTGTYSAATGIVTYTITGGTLAAGATATSRINFTVPANTATITATSTISTAAAETNTTNNTATATIEVRRIAGNIFEDVNYGGGAGRPLSTAGTQAVAAGARVELYSVVGGVPGLLLATTTTDENGDYVFGSGQAVSGRGTVPALANGQQYVVRVVNGSVASTRLNVAGTTGLLPVETFQSNGVTNDLGLVGGQYPTRADANATTQVAIGGAFPLVNATTGPQSYTTVALPATGTIVRTGVDFGFNFDTVVNTNASGQGSLAQFITNANALSNAGLEQAGLTAGVESSIFMIYGGQPVAGYTTTRLGLTGSLLNASGVAVITATANLPVLTDASTSIDGTTQTTNIGNTNAGTLGAGGTVGTGATTLNAVNRPEVQLVGSSARAVGLDVASTATGTNIQGIAIYGFGNGTDLNANANIRIAANNVTVTESIVGNSATNFSSASPVASNADNIRVTGGSNLQILGNLIGFANGKGIDLGNSVTGTLISGNEIRANGVTIAYLDGIDVRGSSVTVSDNLITGNSGQGVDSFNSTGNNTISGNTITGNGTGNTGTGVRETAAIRLYGTGSTVAGNVISNNYGAGISVVAASTNNVFSQNSISGNGSTTGTAGAAASGQIGIDLLSSTDNVALGTAPFVTLNDNGDADTGANGLLNMPIIQSATIRNGNLLLAGFAKAGALLEFFIAAPNDAALNAVGANFGQGETYLFSRTEGASGADLDATTDSYSGLINGFSQGSENNQNQFLFSIPLASLTAAQRTALTATGVQLTATATITAATAPERGTSEFSGNAPIRQAPVATNDTDSTTPGTAITLTVTTNDQNSIDPATVALNGLAAGSTTAVSVTGGTFQFLSNGQVQFTPAAGFTGVATVPYTVNNTSGTVSNTAYIAVTVRNPSIDLATTISAPANNTAINGGAALSYTVTATNNSGTAVSGVVETLQLPAGLTNGGGTVAITGGANAASATYDNTTGLVSIPVGTLAASNTQTYTVAVSAMPGSGPITATANISGAGTETNTTNNTAATTVTVNPRYDVTTTLSGPATNVVRGNEVSYTVTTSNLSTTPGSVSVAPNVVQTVQLPVGLTGVYASNGGTYNAGNGVVTFPAIAALPVGQTVVNSISFVAPSANFAALTARVTAGATSNNAGDINSPTSGANNNTANLNNSTAAVTTVAGGAAVNVYTTISSSAAVVAPSGSVTFTVVTGNAGPASAAGVLETLQLPAGLTANGAVTVSAGGSYNNTTGLVTFAAIGTLAPGATNPAAQTVTFVAPTQGFVLATATAYTTSSDVLPADNLAQTKVEISPRADVATTLAGPATVVPGQAVTYTVTTSSNAEGTALGVVQRVLLPAGLTGVTVSNGTYDAATGIVTISFPNALAKGFTQTNSISYTVPAGATSYVATASVSSSTPETVLTNNSAAVATTVQASVDVRVAVSGPASAPVGSPVTYVVTSTNNGPSVATDVATTLQLPAGLTVGGAVTVTGGGSYDNATGLVSFTAVNVLATGGSYSNSVTVVMPDASQLSGVARVSSTTSETNLDNNVASVATTGAAPTGATAATTANLATTISASATSVAPGTAVTVTANFSNVAGSATASTVAPSIALPAGLSAFGTVTVVGGTGGSYDNATGLVTWNSVGTLNGGAALPNNSYRVTFNAPRNGSVTATSVVSSATSDIVPGNNTATTTINVTASADPATSISGPVSVQPGAPVSYAVTTLNNGVSLASSTQTVTIPAGATNITYSGATGPVAVANGTTLITFPAISNQTAGVAGQITNYVSFTAPATNYTVTANLTPASATGDVAGNNSASVATAVNRAPVAYNVVNSLQTPEANTAGSLLISPLVATDADATQTLTYTITSLPDATAGDLYLGTTKVTALSQVASLSTAQISTLRFDPAAGFIGNAFFNYSATDNATTAAGTSIAATSNTATYTIAVGQDVNSAYASTTLKGGANPYQNNDVIAFVTDANGARYTSAGVVYDVATGALVAGASNGLPTTGTNATTDAAGTTLLTSLGLTLNPTTGQIYVSDRTKLRTAGTYTVSITTVDVNGGTNTQNVTFSIGARPLPVELKAFDVTAQNNDANLSWSTASEKNNDHFDVERSFDGRTFERITQVRGQGTTSQATAYAFTDVNVGRKQQGLVYYRLQQVDTDGTAVYSPVRTVSFAARVAAEVKLSVFPNPATSQDRTATLDLTTLPVGTYQATLLDATGRSMGTYEVQGGVNKALDVQALPSGTYIVLVRGNNLNLNVRLIKE